MSLRDSKRIPKIIAKLQELWELCPDLRFGQMAYYIAGWHEPKKPTDLFNIEDDDFLAKLEKVLLMEKRSVLGDEK